ncbi:methylenetetrahydrofolate reductase [Klugiella xanthotipulae]|uniref:methylenetetrahydrofolate reductase n=1 Tax=Klugiella xanthotipulae TaxID=244735 RepID=UPI001FE77DEA|nr:methylenetetrahydrofolate reductase [Klugiella xanthotipulae]
MPFSFEVFPARSARAALSLGHTVQNLAAAGPDFISVTYGASGSSRDSSLDLLRYIREHTTAKPLAHLTSIGSTRAEIEQLVAEFCAAGVYDFLALRGDPPAGVPEEEVELGELGDTAELVRLIRATVARRVAEHAPDVGLAGAGPAAGRVCIAAFPNGHIRSETKHQDVLALLAKQEAGAEFAITQLFFYADDYLDYVAAAREAGVSIPILPGLMPVSTEAQLRKVSELAGQVAPADLLADFQAADGFAPEYGVAHTTRLATELIESGAPGIHLYTFNRHQSALSVLRELGVITTHPFDKEIA